MAEEFCKMKCKTISFEKKVLTALFTLQVSNTIQRSEHLTAQ